jgi:hypothetical protein
MVAAPANHPHEIGLNAHVYVELRGPFVDRCAASMLIVVIHS